MIAGFIYLLDSDGNKVYGRKYISKSERSRIIEKIVKFYRLENKCFILQIAPYVSQD